MTKIKTKTKEKRQKQTSKQKQKQTNSQSGANHIQDKSNYPRSSCKLVKTTIIPNIFMSFIFPCLYKECSMFYQK